MKIIILFLLAIVQIEAYVPHHRRRTTLRKLDGEEHDPNEEEVEEVEEEEPEEPEEVDDEFQEEGDSPDESGFEDYGDDDEDEDEDMDYLAAEEHGGAGESHHGGEDDSMIHFEDNSEAEHLRNFKKISDDIKEIEQLYSDCIKDIPDDEYTQQLVESCVGKDFLKVELDIKYENMKILARGDQTIKNFMLDDCYLDAGEDNQKSEYCDILERDTLKLLWNQLPFHDLVELNKDKYLKLTAEMEPIVFKHILEKFQNFAVEFFELLDEVDSHKEVTLLRLKELIDDRTKIVMAMEEQNPEVQTKTVEHEIDAVVTDNADETQVEETNLPEEQLDQSRKLAKKVRAQKNTFLLPSHRKTRLIPRDKPNKYRLNGTVNKQQQDLRRKINMTRFQQIHQVKLNKMKSQIDHRNVHARKYHQFYYYHEFILLKENLNQQ